MTEVRAPDPDRLFAIIDATWPAHRVWVEDGWTLRQGCGGGKRVSAATPATPNTVPDIQAASRIMRRLGQDKLFMIRPQDKVLDQALADQEFQIIDPVTVLQAEVARLQIHTQTHQTVVNETPTEAMGTVWAAGGILEGRLDVMRRCALPKACFGICADGEVVATAFVAIDGRLAMAHAVEVLAPLRGKGYGRSITQAVIRWAREQGADGFSVVTTKANTAALGLYHGMGMTDICEYHYRIKID
jgi:GNAT superfamily N-acetyltransferase